MAAGTKECLCRLAFVCGNLKRDPGGNIHTHHHSDKGHVGTCTCASFVTVEIMFLSSTLSQRYSTNTFVQIDF